MIVDRYFETGYIGERTGRQLFIRRGQERPDPQGCSIWRLDQAFNANEERANSNGFGEVLRRVATHGYALVLPSSSL